MFLIFARAVLRHKRATFGLVLLLAVASLGSATSEFAALSPRGLGLLPWND